MPVLYWVILVVFIDVAHVYSTLYRTYFNPAGMGTRRNLLLTVPLACYVMAVLLYHANDMWFWRILAYLAVFHFVRQQYGIMRLYSRKENNGMFFEAVDKVAIYTATLYPLLYWHLSADRNFNWFIAGDFLYFNSAPLREISFVLYLAVILIYFLKEGLIIFRYSEINIPRNLVIAGTFLSWYFGIVYFNGDMAFTMLNVISHGIPYMALIWFFEKQKVRPRSESGPLQNATSTRYGLLFFIGSIILFAYLEEGLWDGFVWRENASVFGIFSFLPAIHEKDVLALLVPLLALPQMTHYVLDGFIWKKSRATKAVTPPVAEHQRSPELQS